MIDKRHCMMGISIGASIHGNAKEEEEESK